MWRCIEDMEDLLRTMPGVLANRDTNEHLSAEELIRVGVREIAVQPIKSGPSFIIQEGASRILEHLNDGERHHAKYVKAICLHASFIYDL
jgi:hypothetical protein